MAHLSSPTNEVESDRHLCIFVWQAVTSWYNHHVLPLPTVAKQHANSAADAVAMETEGEASAELR